ncbi:diaminobutyrate--2-oxoglutarate transaminase [Bacillus sp. R86525]|uniref:diaminobutyrate--2-oxoglutarate transaminase n=1 Tax=Bacillus sp. R86525 TaxID=3101709 RepID=UPI0036716FD4
MLNESQYTDLNVFEDLESSVRSYSRCFPTVFDRSKGFKIWGENGKEYIDFFAGAGALNYGHNDPYMKKQLLDYIQKDGIAHSLDMGTMAKANFLIKFQDVILSKRGLNYKIMFPGPTGTNAVESALKIARKITGRTGVFSFTNSFHGMSIGSLSVSSNRKKRKGAGVPLNNGVSLPYENYINGFDSLEYLRKILNDNGSGIEIPAAIIVETVQGEGGLHKMSFEWLRELRKICDEFDILLIIDDIQTGCGRTGTFFSFEPANISPDVICLSKSISGYGLPMSLTLIKPEFDNWFPGEHNGTFRGNNLAFVTGTAALKYWENTKFEESIQKKADKLSKDLHGLIEKYPEIEGEHRGRGLIQGIYCKKNGLAERVCATAFENGLICETSGSDSQVIKIIPPLIIDSDGLQRGLDIIEYSIQQNLSHSYK